MRGYSDLTRTSWVRFLWRRLATPTCSYGFVRPLAVCQRSKFEGTHKSHITSRIWNNVFPLHSCTHGLVAMTSASHAEGRQFDPGWVYVRRFCLDHGLTVLAQLVKMSALHVLCCVVHIQAARLVRHGEDMIGCLCFGTSAPCTSEMRNDHLERLFVHLGWPVSAHHWACV